MLRDIWWGLLSVGRLAGLKPDLSEVASRVNLFFSALFYPLHKAEHAGREMNPIQHRLIFFSGQKLPFIKKKNKKPSSVFPYMPQSGKLPECIIYIKPSALERSVIVGFLAMHYNTACLVSQPEVLLHLFVFLSPVTRLFF